MRWPGKVPAGKVSNELVHLVDMFPTLAKVAGAEVPTDRQIDGMDMGDFLLGDAEESGRNTVLCMQGNRLQAIKWRQWKANLMKQDDMFGTWSAYNMPHLHNLEWDPREEHEVGFPHAWVMHPMAAAAGAFLKTLAMEPPIQPGTPDPYTPPGTGGVAARDAHPGRTDHPVQHGAGQVPRRTATAPPRARAPVRARGSVSDTHGNAHPADAGTRGARPPNLGFMVGWLVFLGIYQIALAWRFGTFFEGERR